MGKSKKKSNSRSNTETEKIFKNSGPNASAGEAPSTKLVNDSDEEGTKNEPQWERGKRQDFDSNNARTGSTKANSFFNSRTYRPSNTRKEDTRRSEPFRRGQQDFGGGRENKRFSEIGTAKSSIQRRNNRSFKDDEDPEFIEYQREFRFNDGKIEYLKIKEITANLFTIPDDYSLAHCVAEDMNMGSGIAVQFRRDFKRVDELLNQRQQTGGLAILEDDGRYIYYLVTKRVSTGKPTYATLFSSLQKLRCHMVEHEVRKLAIPRIGCGLDRLQWSNVKFMVNYIFRDVDVEIVVCNLEPTEDSPQQKHKNCKVTHETYPIKDIESGTIIVYFSSEDECISEEMQSLDEKFHFLQEFRFGRKKLGDVIFNSKTNGYLLCGCIVRKNKKDSFDFVAFRKCLQSIQKENKKHQLYYYAFQAFKDDDSCINQKIINIMRNSLRDVEVYVCWVGDLQNELLSRDQYNDSFGKKEECKTSGDWRAKKNDSDNSLQNPVVDYWDQDEDDVNTSLKFKSQQEEPVKKNWTAMEEFEDEDEKNIASKSKFQKEKPTEKNLTAMEKLEPRGQWTNLAQKQDSNIEEEYDSFQKALHSNTIQCCSLIKEQTKPSLPKQFSRICFAREDFIIEHGIPPGIEISKHLGGLLDQNKKEGEVAWVKENNGYLYCLVVNRANAAPTSQLVYSAVKQLQVWAVKHRVRTLVVPKIDDEASPLSEIKNMLHFIFRTFKIEIIIAPFESTCNISLLKQKNWNKITHVKSPLHQMKKKSIILYLASTDGAFTSEMEGLSRKFDFDESFKKTKKTLGGVIRHKQDEDHILYGCVVKRKSVDPIDFIALQTCLLRVNEENKTDGLPVVAIQAVETADDSVNFKIATILLHCIHTVTINICWPGVLRYKMSPSV